MRKLLTSIGIMVCMGATSITQATDQELDAASLEPDALVELNAFINDLVEKDTFSGAVLLAKDGKTLYSAARGLASKRFNVPNNLQTRFSLASLNKMFTSTAVMQLVEQNKIALNDKLDQYLDDSWLPKTMSYSQIWCLS